MREQRRTIKCKCGERIRFKFPRGYRKTEGYCPDCKTKITLHFDTGGGKTGRLIGKYFGEDE